MPGLIMERPKMSQQMHENLKRYILKERRRKKEEDVANEQKLKEEMRKAEMTTQSIENIKEQIRDTETKLEELNHRKRDLFAQLKKVLNEETNLKKKPIEIQQPSQAMQQQQSGGGPPPPFLFQPGIHQPAGVYPQPGGPPPQSVLFTQQLKFLSPSPQAPTPQRLQMFKPEPLIQVPQQQQQLKRQRSPSPLPQLLQTPSSLLPTSNSSPVSNQTTAFSPNTKKTRPNTVTSSNINQPQQTTPPSIQIPTTFQPNIIQPQTPTRLTSSSYGQQTPGQQSAFSTYQGSYLGAAMQQPQQKATLLGVQPPPTTPPSSSVHAIPAYALTNTPPRPIPTGQIDLQKLLYPQGLLNAHPQSGGILSGYPLQRQPGQSSHQQQQQQQQQQQYQ